MEILEGRICVLAALRAGRRSFECVLVRQGTKDDSIQDILEAAQARGVRVERVRAEALDSRSHARSHGGLLAVATPLPPGEAPARMDFALLLDGVDDPRNLGYTLRSAEAFGVNAVYLRKRAWDFDGGDVSRASSGAYERLPLILGDAIPESLRLIGCLAGPHPPIDAEDLTRPVALALGGEKRGLSAAVRGRCRSFVTIPTASGSPSLSLTHAAAVAMAEVARQRRQGGGVIP